MRIQNRASAALYSLSVSILMTDNLNEDGILIWDEPEANLNPKFLSKIVFPSYSSWRVRVLEDASGTLFPSF